MNRGCHNPPCENGTGPLDGGNERRENFRKVLDVFFEEDGSPRKYRPSGGDDMANLVTTARDEEEEEVKDWSQIATPKRMAGLIMMRRKQVYHHHHHHHKLQSQ